MSKQNPTHEDVFGTKEIESALSLPGVDSPKINGDVSVEGGSGEGQAFTVGGYIGTATPGDVTYSGFGFTPKKVMIQGSGSVGLGYFNSAGTKVDQSTTPTGSDGHLIYLVSGATINTGFLKEFTADGFTITWDRIDSDTIYFYSTCFSNI